MQSIFRDYEVQLSYMRQAEFEQDAKEFRVAELARLRAEDRLAAQIGRQLKTQGVDGRLWAGELLELGMGWIQLKEGAESMLIPIAAIEWWEGGDSGSFLEANNVSRKLTLSYALRALATSRLPVRVFHGSAQRQCDGTIEAVGLDHLILRVHPIDQPVSQGASTVRTIMLNSVTCVWSSY